MGCGTSSNTISDVDIPVQDLFKKQQLIGVGNHATVYRCIHTLSHQQKAIKVINKLEYLEKSLFSRENYPETLTLFKSLKHQNLISYDYAELTGSQLSIILEIAKDGTLKKHIQKHGKTTEEFSSNILKQILNGLNYLHSQGILHKDLKSTNVLMFGDNIKITDYGLAQLYDPRLGQSAKAKGKGGKKYYQFSRGDSLPYMAPEIILDQGLSVKSDVWSIGCIAIEMLTSKVPWSNVATAFEDAFKKIQKSQHPPLPLQLTKQCVHFLKSCLAVSPQKRLTVEQLLVHPFITKIVNQSDVYFTLQPQNDNTNRAPSINSRNSNRKGQQILKTPSKGQKRYTNQNITEDQSASRKGLKSQRARHRRQPESSPKSQINRSLPHIVPTVDYTNTLNKQDALPQINEDEEDPHIVMLNNKKTKMRPSQPKIFNNHMKTQPTRDMQNRNSITLQDEALSDSFEDNRALDSRVVTQSSLLVSDSDLSKDYFKRPLKLLKKKIEQSKRKAKLNSLSNFSGSYTNQSSGKLGIQNRQKQYRNKNSKIKTNTDTTQEEKTINTEFAKAERDRYIHEQLFMKRQREEQRAKWEEELKKQAEQMRLDFSRRYAYPYPV